MTRALLALVMAVSVIGCDNTHTGFSALQGLDALRMSLRSSTQDARIVSTEVAALRNGMNHSDVPAIQISAVRLRGGALELCRQTGRNGYLLRQILPGARNPALRRYVSMVLRVMVLQWWEGATLTHVSILTWHDPYVWLRDDPQRLYSWQLNARWYAWQASSAAIEANSFLEIHRHEFRYPAGPPRS